MKRRKGSIKTIRLTFNGFAFARPEDPSAVLSSVLFMSCYGRPQLMSVDSLRFNIVSCLDLCFEHLEAMRDILSKRRAKGGEKASITKLKNRVQRWRKEVCSWDKARIVYWFYSTLLSLDRLSLLPGFGIVDKKGDKVQEESEFRVVVDKLRESENKFRFPENDYILKVGKEKTDQTIERRSTMENKVDVNFNELKKAASFLNKAEVAGEDKNGEEVQVSLLAENIRTVGVKKDVLVEAFMTAVESVPEADEGSIPPEAVDMYNFLRERSEAPPESESVKDKEETPKPAPKAKKKEAKKAEKKDKKEEEEKIKTPKYNRTQAFCEALKEGSGTLDKIWERTDEIAIANGLKTNQSEKPFIGGRILQALEYFEIVSKDESKVFTLLS